MPENRRVIAWLEADQIDLVRDTLRAADLTLVGAGSPVRGQSGVVAGALSCPPNDDLRKVLSQSDCELVWLASAGDFGSSLNDPGAVLEARTRNVRIACLPPVPASAIELSTMGWLDEPSAAKSLRFVGLPRFGRSFRDAVDVLAQFGTPRYVDVQCWSRPGEGGLGAKLFAAVDLVQFVLGEPERVMATHIPPESERGSRPPTPERLAGISGELMAQLRFSDGRGASIEVSDSAGRWNIAVTMVSASGRLRVYDDGFEWIGHDGAKRDELRLRKRDELHAHPPAHAVSTLADQLARLLDPAMPDIGPVNLKAVLSTSQAALLSVRTGQAESPSTISRMAETG